MSAPLARQRLFVVTGKGGVGKSVTAAVLARVLADRGRRVLVLETDPRESQHRLLGCSPSGGDVVAADALLSVQNLDAAAAIEERVREQVRIGAIARRVCGSEAFRTFVAGAPGLGEVAVLGHALRVTEGRARGVRRHDVVVLDAPATGHGVSLLDAPSVVADVVGSGPFGDLARQVAAPIGDAAATAIVAVTLAEEMPVDELFELEVELRRVTGRAPALVVVNGLHPELPEGELPAGPATELWRRRRALEERELARVDAHGFPAVARLPLRAERPGPELVAALALHMASALASAPEPRGGR